MSSMCASNQLNVFAWGPDQPGARCPRIYPLVEAAAGRVRTGIAEVLGVAAGAFRRQACASAGATKGKCRNEEWNACIGLLRAAGGVARCTDAGTQNYSTSNLAPSILDAALSNVHNGCSPA